ncbi:pyridine nucleotide-disulfide oxidoreductase-domain-containing protein [Zychaea mexicana]|uniref:pyridine nucleotide-disulfide oxidoreductase-domain-containing protein n=1 Tax=Zychaea mexicana TaxID=64656 RepID=UPI0022FF0FAE|nr:pyridine nucleotide-disulfide oxidoreductase-domain-containing protein [Zychaea mexicana]KAI9485133.1 pyridine nucleotide-disulfide oxidoreductase-domain-containing protein [Zychaea mexicana]
MPFLTVARHHCIGSSRRSRKQQEQYYYNYLLSTFNTVNRSSTSRRHAASFVWRSSNSARYYTTDATTATAAPSSTSRNDSHKSRKWIRRGLWTLSGVAATGAAVYYLIQDVEYIGVARGAHKAVPSLALHPNTGGNKDLPIVTHQLDDDNPEAVKKLTKPRIVVLGGGWGAVAALQQLNPDDYNVTLVSDNNYFLFTPLLPSATVGTLEMRSLLESLRKIVARVHGHFLEGTAVDVDLNNKYVEVIGADGEDKGKRFYVPYDKLLIAVGSTSITHGVEGLEHTFRLKTIQDAMAVRRTVTRNVEQASLPTTSPEERKRLLSFVICGGGPTGVEFAAEIYDWMNEDLVKWFPKILREDISVTIIQSRDHILNTFDVKISEYAERKFSREGINLITNARVLRILKDKVVYRNKDAEGDKVGFGEVPYGLCMWSTGIAMTPFALMLAEKLGKQVHQRAIQTDAYCRVLGLSDGSIFAIGDCATIKNQKLLDHIMELFENADQDKDGSLTLDEFASSVEEMRTRFPLTKQHLGELVHMFKKYDADNSGTLEVQEMHTLLSDIDKKMTQLPATAQVASQQGAYVGRLLNQLAKDENDVDKVVGPFQYRHLGSLAYLGNTAVGEFGWGYKMIGGLYAQYLWRSVYWSKQVSLRTRINLSIDWSRNAMFGRDITTV